MEEKEFIVIGCGRFGSSVAITLSDLGHEVLVVDKDEEIINKISEKVTHAICADVTEEGVLESLGLDNFDECIVAISSNFEAAVLSTAIAKEHGIRTVIVKVTDEVHAAIMRKVGADQVYIPERDMGMRLAYHLSDSNILDFIEISEDYSIVEVKTPRKWVGKSLQELDIRNKYHITVIAVGEENTKDININPRPDYILSEKDIMLIVGNNQKVERIIGKE